MKPLPIDSGQVTSTGRARRAPALPWSRFVAATIELGIRDDTLLTLQVDAVARTITVTEQVLDNEGRVILGAHSVREIVVAAPEVLKG